MENGTLPKTREVLCEHLQAKILYLKPDLADQLTKIVAADKSNDEIIELLVSDSLLEETVDKAILSLPVPNTEVREIMGKALFQAVLSVEKEHCAQVTGMLLELPIPTLSGLLKDRIALQEAVAKAKSEYLRYLQGNNQEQESSSASFEITREKEELGEVIYEKIALRYPREAAKLTGMMLQMEYKDLVRVIAEPELLKSKVELAHSVLQSELRNQN